MKKLFGGLFIIKKTIHLKYMNEDSDKQNVFEFIDQTSSINLLTKCENDWLSLDDEQLLKMVRANLV